jgi:hypothetical protein
MSCKSAAAITAALALVWGSLSPADAQAFNRDELYINGAPVSSSNALPVSGGSGGSSSVGSVGAAGVNGTTAQSIQGITGGVPVPVAQSGTVSTTDTNMANTYVAGTAASPAGEQQIGGQYEAAPLNMTNGTSGPLQITQAGALEVAELDIPAVNSLNLTSTANVLTLPIANGESTMAMEFVGLTAGVATIAMYGSVDGTNFAQIGFQTSTLGYITSLNADTPLVRVNVAGLKAIQIRITVAGTGSATITSNVTAATNPAVVLAANATTGVPYMTPSSSAGASTVIGNAIGHLGAPADIAVADYNALLEAFTEQTLAGGGTPAMDQYGAAYSDTEGVKPTFQSWGFITPIQGITYSFCGSTKQTRIRDLSLQGIATTAGGVPFYVRLVSTAPTGGTSAGFGAVRNQSTDSYADIAPLSYSVAPTSGSNANLVESGYIGFPLVSSPNAPTDKKWGGIDGTKSIVLTGTSQCIQIEMQAAPPAGAQLSVGLTWTEQ